MMDDNLGYFQYKETEDSISDLSTEYEDLWILAGKTFDEFAELYSISPKLAEKVRSEVRRRRDIRGEPKAVGDWNDRKLPIA